MVNSVHHNFIFFRYSFYKSISGSISNDCGYVLALAVRFRGIGYLVIDDGIH